MSDVIIRAENISKSFLIGHQKNERYTALRDVIVNNVKGVLYKTKQFIRSNNLLNADEQEEFWALSDINFEIKKGDRVGIIGRNGAGKSTLLKILSRITEPTKGRISLKGRVASLLEVGTGFHPELSGRENIYLNGAILGMNRNEIKMKFDEIVDFAEVEKFLDTPVKRYSSGMYVRLAFAVAAHLEQEILIVDEVLAVGDAQFQKKCLGKMNEISLNEGRTVLFVSHNMGVISSLCNRGFFMDKGCLTYVGTSKDAINVYLNAGEKFYIYENVNQDHVGIVKAFFSNTNQIGKNEFLHDQYLSIKFNINMGQKRYFDIGIAVLDKFKTKVFTSIKNIQLNTASESKLIINCIIPSSFLAPGDYSIDVSVFNGRISTYEYVQDILPFKIIDNGTDLASFEGIDYGNVLCNCTWKIEAD